MTASVNPVGIIAKTVRIITLAPLMALATLITLYVNEPQLFGANAINLWLAILFLTVLPILAYPLQPVIPGFKGKGREGQRNLAMVFAVSGYTLGCITNLFLKAPEELWLIYLTYLISGAAIVFVNKKLHIRASAHACGIIGPAVMLAAFGIPAALLVGVPLHFAALWASLKMKRHTVPQYVAGSIIPIAVLAILKFLFFIF